MSADLHFFYCGNGDTILVRGGCEWGLIDCNLQSKNPKTRTRVAALLDEHRVERLAFVCLTHYDKDHVCGMASFLRERFSKGGDSPSSPRQWLVGQIIQPLHAKDIARAMPVLECAFERIGKGPQDAAFSKEALAFLQVTHEMLMDSSKLPPADKVYMPQYGVSSFYVAPLAPSGGRARLGPFEICFIGPEQEIAEGFEANKLWDKCENSPTKDLFRMVTNNAVSRIVVFRHVATGQAVVFGGDAPVESWNPALSRWDQVRHIGTPDNKRSRFKKFHIVKVSHHGARDGHACSLYEDWCISQKTIAVISCESQDQRHPHPVVLRELESLGIPVTTTGLRPNAKAPVPKTRRGAVPGGKTCSRSTSDGADIRIKFTKKRITVAKVDSPV